MQTFCLLMYCKILFQPACGVNVLLYTSLDHLYTLWSKHAERGLVGMSADLTCAMQGL